MPTADAGQHRGDMAIADLERLAKLPVAPGDAGQAPLEGGDRQLRPAAFDLRGEVEADRFRVGRRLRKPLAAQPGGEVPPVGGVGALGVVGLRRAGVGLGGLGERRQPPAEPPGGREQGRGIRAGMGPEPLALRVLTRQRLPPPRPGCLPVGWPGGAAGLPEG